MKISHKIFNPLYHHIVKYLSDPNIRYMFFYGGSSAGKTYSIMQALSFKSMNEKYDCLVMRKYSSNLKKTIFKDFKTFNNKLKRAIPSIEVIQNEIRYKNSNIEFGGVDDPEKLKGIAGFTKVFADELTEFNEQDFKQLRKRLRGRPNQQIIGAWNPVSKDHWIKKKIIDKNVWLDVSKSVEGVPFSTLSENSDVQINATGDTVLIKTTYLDNYWVVGHPHYKKVGYYDKHVIADFEKDKIEDENNYNIYALGLWGSPSEGLVWKYAKDFDNIGAREKKIYWSKYTELPDLEYFTVLGLDFGGGGGTQTDEVNGSSKTVLKEYKINKATKSIYHKLIIYRGHIETPELANILESVDGSRVPILCDNVRKDKVTELANKGFMVIPAKTKEGGSKGVVSGYDILREYNHYIYNNDLQCFEEYDNHKWAINRLTGEPTGQPEDKYKDVTDSDRYAIVYYHLNYNY